MNEDLVDKLLKVNNRNETFCKEQIQRLREFDVFIRARRPITEITRYNQIGVMMRIAEDFKKPFEEVTRSEMENYLGEQQEIYSPASMEQKKVLIKKFWKWLEKPEIVERIKLRPSAYKKDIDPKSLWTDEEVIKLIQALPKVQHKALVAVLYESEARVSELLSMNICDVAEQGKDIKIYLRVSKTKKRNVGLCFSVSYLKKWLDIHPYRNNPDHPLWFSESDRCYGMRLSACSVNQMLNIAQQRCGVDKKIHPHLLRHSMCSNLRRRGYPDAPHRIRMGLKPGSKIIERYTHISEDDAHREYQKTQGIKVPEEEQEPNLFEPIKCWKCGTENTPTTKYCSVCSTNITVESAERDFEITEVFRSNFAKFIGVDVDKIITQYQHFKVETHHLDELLNCFNGENWINTESLRQQLPWDDDLVIEVFQYLITAEMVSINNGNVYLLSREKFEHFIQMQKRYLEVNQ